MDDTELNLETLTKAAHSTAEEEDAKMQKINNLLKMIEAQVPFFFYTISSSSFHCFLLKLILKSRSMNFIKGKIYTRSLGTRWAPTSRWQPFVLALILGVVPLSTSYTGEKCHPWTNKAIQGELYALKC